MFSFGGSVEKRKWTIGMFEAKARRKLLEAKKATKRDKELSQLCDKLDDLIALAGTLTRLMLQYVEKHLPESEADEILEYEKFKGIIDFETFQLIKHVMIEHLQRTESASQLIDILEDVPDNAKKAVIIHVALEIALNQDEYSSPKNIDTSMLNPPLSMTPDEFEKANARYECILEKVDNYICRSDLDDREKCAHLARMIFQPGHSRSVKTMLFVRAWSCEEKNRFSVCHHDSGFDEFLRRVEADIDEQIAVLQAGETPASTDAISLPAHTPDTEEFHNGMMEERLQRLLSMDEEYNGGNE